MDENKINKLKEFLARHISKLKGSFVSKNSGYDNDICNLLPNFNENTKRYWDAFWETEKMFIEFKKGKTHKTWHTY